MSDDAYIQPSEREFDIEDCYEIDAFGSECHGIEKLRASHAVVDSVAAEQHRALRLAARFIMARSGEILVTEDQAVEWLTGASGLLARYDALHKEAGQ